MTIRTIPLLCVLLGAVQCQAVQAGQPSRNAAGASQSTGREKLPPKWWEKAAAVCSLSLRTGRTNSSGASPAGQEGSRSLLQDPARVAVELDKLKALGCSAVDVYQPSETSGRVYPALATKDHYTMRQGATIEDFRALIRLAHERGLAVTIFYNLGYASLDAPHFLKACDDIREGRKDTKEARFFLWSDRVDAPSPPGDSIFMITDPFRVWLYGHSPDGPGPNSQWLGLRMAQSGIWEPSKRAGGKFYWSKWGGVNGLDDQGNRVQLPHYNYYNQEWQQEAEKILRFWMDTGLDGVTQDAPNWYVGCGWEMTRRRITGVCGSYGNVYLQAEGAGAFYEDPSVWITEGGYNSIRDYYLPSQVRMAVETGDPRPIEAALQHTHDRVVAAGGVLWGWSPPRLPDAARQHLAYAAYGLSGTLLNFSLGALEGDPRLQRLLKLKAEHPALQNVSRRRKIPTDADSKYYAFVRTAADNSERVLVVMNFQPSQQTVGVDLSGVATAGLMDLETGVSIARQRGVGMQMGVDAAAWNPVESPRTADYLFKVTLPGYGYRVYQLKPAEVLP